MIITLASIFTFVSETHYLFKQVKLANGTLVPAPEPEVVTKSCCCVPEAPHITNHTGDEYSNETHNETGGHIEIYITSILIYRKL